MKQESRIEFQRRWVQTAEADLQLSKRELRFWVCVFIPIAAAHVCITRFVSRSGWAIGVEIALMLLFLFSFVKVALSGSKLGDARKFLRQCREGLANEIQVTH